MLMSNQPLFFVAPEIFLGFMASLILILDRYLVRVWQAGTYLLSQVTVIITFFLSLQLWGLPTQSIFHNSFILDPLSTGIKLILLLFAFFVFLYTKKYLWQRNMIKGEYFVLSLFSILGMMVLVSARNFISLYLGLELLALPLYALIAFNRHDKAAPEAAMKYFVMGGLASGMLLYGISLLYGITGSLEFSQVSVMLAKQAQSPNLSVLLALVFVIVGLAFKFGAVPFHLWVPDVYQGSMSSVTLFVATLPELAAFGMAMRLLQDALANLSQYWQPLLMIMAVLSLAIGNIAAIAQSNLKRMLAYSTIGHMGFVFLGLLAGPESGYAAAFAYIIIYSMMALAAFAIIITLSHQGFEAENIQDFRGLGSTQPWVAFLMLLVLFSLAGVPPTVGFYAKFMVLDALLNASLTFNPVWLAVLAVIFTVIAAFYYLRVIKVMFFEPKEEFQTISERPSGFAALALSINGLAMLVFGIFPAPIINFCQQIFSR